MRRLLESIRFQKGVDYAKAHPYRALGVLGLIVLVLGAWLLSQGNPEEAAVEATARTVSTMNVADFAEGAVGIAYPTASGDAFVVRAESSGRVTSAAKVGAKVEAGTIVAQIENASERAALTQAQGSYEAARAGAAQSDVSAADARVALKAAEEDAVSANRAALTVWTSNLNGVVDQVFSNPRSTNPAPGLYITSGGGTASSLSKQRMDLAAAQTAWTKMNQDLTAAQNSSTLKGNIDQAIGHVDSLLSVVNTIMTLLPKHQADYRFSADDIATLQAEFAAASTALNNQRAALESAKTDLTRAEEAVTRAEIGGTGGQVSAANAQIKQALGVLQAAQANYNRTIVRAPFAGTITTQNVKVGDIINVGTDVSIIKPDSGVETTRWWHLPLSAVKYTPDNAFVFTVNSDNQIESIAIETGLVTANNIRVTGLTGSESIVKDVRGLKAGDTVEVTTE